MKQILLTIATIICLSIAILSSGVVACFSIPQITQGICRATALADKAHFSRDQLVNLSDSTRAFVAGELERADLYQSVENINKEAKTQYENMEGMDFASVPDDYSLDSNSMNHLEDVQTLFANIRIAFWICTFLSALFLILLLVFSGRGAFGRALALAGFIMIVVILGIVIWAILDFSGFFNFVHSLFFENGSWLFDTKSLLITMYPTSFWVCIGVICALTSAALSITASIVGKIIK